MKPGGLLATTNEIRTGEPHADTCNLGPYPPNLTVAGTALVAKGYAQASDIEPVIGALLTTAYGDLVSRRQTPTLSLTSHYDAHVSKRTVLIAASNYRGQRWGKAANANSS